MSEKTKQNAKLLRLAEDDNVLVALGPIDPGAADLVGGGAVAVRDAVTLGHKISARDIAAGEKVIKYGVPIGSATVAITAGSRVHVHNMQSDYTPTYSLVETAEGKKDA